MIELDSESKLSGPGMATPVRAVPRCEPLPAPRSSQGLRHLFECLLMVLGALGFALIVAGGTVVIATGLMIPDAGRRGLRARRLAALTFEWALAWLGRLGLVKLDLSALDRLRGERSLVIAPNHPSMIDAALMLSRLPDAICIMKSSIGRNWLLGWGAHLCGYIRNDRAHAMIRDSIATLRAGRQLLIFPEGTRTRQFPVSPLTGAFALIARRARAPVQVVVIETNSPFLAKGWPIWRKPDFPLVYRARLGERIEADLSDEEIMALTAQSLHDELEAR